MLFAAGLSVHRCYVHFPVTNVHMLQDGLAILVQRAMHCSHTLAKDGAQLASVVEAGLPRTWWLSSSLPQIDLLPGRLWVSGRNLPLRHQASWSKVPSKFGACGGPCGGFIPSLLPKPRACVEVWDVDAEGVVQCVAVSVRGRQGAAGYELRCTPLPLNDTGSHWLTCHAL